MAKPVKVTAIIADTTAATQPGPAGKHTQGFEGATLTDAPDGGRSAREECRTGQRGAQSACGTTT